jgi:Outer membrane protein beta-barrel domain
MVKKMYVPLVAAALLGVASAAQAQVTIGPRIGLNLANVAFEEDDEFDEKILLAPQVGVSLNVEFGNLAFQPALLFSQKGFKIKEEETMGGVTQKLDATTRFNYLELPLNFVYTTGGSEGFQIFAGPYVGFGLGGKQKSEYSFSGGGGSGSTSGTTKIKFANQEEANSDDAYVRQPDLGLNGGIGYKTGPLQAQLGYSLGLSNLVPNDSNGNKPDDDLSAKNRVIQFSLSYFFGGK